MRARLQHILNHHGLDGLLPLFEEQAVDDTLLGKLTDADLERIGVTRLGDRKRLLEAFHHKTSAHPVLARLAAAGFAIDTERFINGFGMPFVPVEGVDALFCIWPVRVRDFDAYCAATGRSIPKPDFEQGPDHPVVMVTWEEATAYCQWLTDHEGRAGKLPGHLRYRLPDDMEWSRAVGLAVEMRPTPEQRSGKIQGYPWGPVFPPPSGAGNYHLSLGIDDFRETSPVGSFAPNRFGIHDLGGNVWEWCSDRFDGRTPARVLRGASCFNDDETFLLSSHRDKGAPDFRRNNNGMRIVLASEHDKSQVWF